MAVNQTLTFGSVTSSTYNIYISGEGVFDAPKRDTKIVTIPGRNGEFAQDQGRFENITVTYPAFYQATSLASFAQNLANFRAAMCSQIGYQRLTDTINNTEYRMALFIDGINFVPAKDDTFATFDLVFNCKPQRWLTSGETAVTVANNGTITNPTRFSTRPLLAVKGYGTVTMNGYPITLNNTVLGEVTLLEQFGGSPQAPTTAYNTGLVNNGDAITVASGSDVTITLNAASGYTLLGVMVTNNSGVFSVTHLYSETAITLNVTFPAENFTAGTSKTVSGTFTAYVEYETPNLIDTSQTITFTPTMTYNGSARSFGLACSYNAAPNFGTESRVCMVRRVTGNSTVTGLGTPSYIDCEIGEAYKIVNNEAISLNNVVEIGAKLPELAPGNNTVTFPNTITELKVTPRWWSV